MYISLIFISWGSSWIILIYSLAAEMNAKVSSDESALENISIQARPMKIAEDYTLLMSNFWLDAKSALDDVKADYITEAGKIMFLFDILMVSPTLIIYYIVLSDTCNNNIGLVCIQRACLVIISRICVLKVPMICKSGWFRSCCFFSYHFFTFPSQNDINYTLPTSFIFYMEYIHLTLFLNSVLFQICEQEAKMIHKRIVQELAKTLRNPLQRLVSCEANVSFYLANDYSGIECDCQILLLPKYFSII